MKIREERIDSARERASMISLLIKSINTPNKLPTDMLLIEKLSDELKTIQPLLEVIDEQEAEIEKLKAKVESNEFVIKSKNQEVDKLWKMVEFYQNEANPKPKGKRICKGCSRNIDHKHINAKFHSQQCKDDYWNRVNPRGIALNCDYEDDHGQE